MRETAKVKGHLSCSMETESRRFLKYIPYEADLNEMANWGDRAPGGYLLSPHEAFSTGNGLYFIELLAKGVPCQPQTTKAVAKAIGCSPQTDIKPSLLKTTPTQLMSAKKWSWCFPSTFTL